VIFKTATEWVAFLADAQRQSKLDQELDRLERIPLLICDLCRYRDYAEKDLASAVNVQDPRGFGLLAPAGLSA